MAREILFRGKRIDNGEWVEGNLFVSDTDGRTHILVGSRRFTIEWEVDPSTVGQFTGLTDKNGKRIFEGDILRRAYHPNEDMIVEWHDGRFVFYRRIYPKDYGHESLVCCQQTVDRLSIIGNIHDNPELLED